MTTTREQVVQLCYEANIQIFNDDVESRLTRLIKLARADLETENSTLHDKVKALTGALESIALIAHCGGLICMTQDAAMNTIRKLSLPYFDLSMTPNETIEALATAEKCNLVVKQSFSPLGSY